jgi:hypothetical protein
VIESVQPEVIWHGRHGGVTWFHPRACLVPGRGNPTVLMTCQSIGGSDVFGQAHWSASGDVGQTWSDPEPIASLGRRSLPDGLEEGVCDVVPEYHAQTGTVLAVGHNVYYRDNVLTRPSEGRCTVYVVRDGAGRWSERRTLHWAHPDTSGIYSAGCAQRVTLADGDVLVPLSFGPIGRADRAVTTVRCGFDGEMLAAKAEGNVLRLQVGRGLLEPSLARLGERFYMTLRAEDGHGYASTSADGLDWTDLQPWRWDDGEPLTMSTTQQRWLVHSEALYLVYTRRSEENVNVFRWRAPLYTARVDPARLCLVRETEQVVLPLRGDGVNDAARVARMGNFHTVNVSPRESWVTVGETLPSVDWRGDTLLARIRWEALDRTDSCAGYLTHP